MRCLKTWGQSENRLAYGIPGASPDPTPCPSASQCGAGSICHTGTGERAGALGLSAGLLSYSLEKRTEREQECREICLGTCAQITLIMSQNDSQPFVALGFYFPRNGLGALCYVPVTERQLLWPPEVWLLKSLQRFTWILPCTDRDRQRG